MSVRIRLDNIVATAYFTQSDEKLDLEEVAEKFSDMNTAYKKENFPAVVVRFVEPPVSALIFSSGKAIITGAKNTDHIYTAVTKILERVYDAEENRPTPHVEFVNRVYTVTMDNVNEINLDKLALVLPNCEYDPEQFTGLIYRPRRVNAVLLVFTSGKMVCAGAKSIDDVKQTILEFTKDLEKNDITLPTGKDGD